VSGSGISWAICKSAPRSRQITMPAPHHSVFTGWMPFLPPNQQRQSTEGRNLIKVVEIGGSIIIITYGPSIWKTRSKVNGMTWYGTSLWQAQSHSWKSSPFCLALQHLWRRFLCCASFALLCRLLLASTWKHGVIHKTKSMWRITMPTEGDWSRLNLVQFVRYACQHKYRHSTYIHPYSLYLDGLYLLINWLFEFIFILYAQLPVYLQDWCVTIITIVWTEERVRKFWRTTLIRAVVCQSLLAPTVKWVSFSYASAYLVSEICIARLFYSARPTLC